jgi:hypothetical protein
MSEYPETEPDATTKAAHYNPLLCQECQIWNDTSRLIRHFHRKSTGPHLKGRIDNRSNVLETAGISCLVCNAAFAAARARLASSREPNAPCTGTDEVYIVIGGPILLEDSHSVGRSLDNSQPGQSILRIAIQVRICLPQSDYPNLLWMKPRFCLRYTTSSPVRLVSLEPWDHPFFDIGLLRQWIHTCEDIHEEQAIAPVKGTSKSSGPVNLIYSFSVMSPSFTLLGLFKTLLTS